MKSILVPPKTPKIKPLPIPLEDIDKLTLPISLYTLKKLSIKKDSK